MKDIEVDFAKKGEVDRSGRKDWTNNSADLRYSGDLPDKYDDRIRLLIDAIGGEIVLSELISLHSPKDVFILLEIPAKSSSKNEEGYISHEMLKLLVQLEIELHFWYV
ncbi:MAG: hypothetical protein SGJ19_00285 [Planctomycetia bacterium]|nr:hypothetical protein [Planctomycetia bacterium]